MEIVFHLILVDTINKDVWKTPNHNKDKTKDDFHREVKQDIKADLSRKLREQFGDNVNIEIRDGEIYIISQIFDEITGRRTRKGIETGLKAENYFDKVSNFMLFTIIHEFLAMDCNMIVIKIDKNNLNIVKYSIEYKLIEKYN
jgi:hypothetical protein